VATHNTRGKTQPAAVSSSRALDCHRLVKDMLCTAQDQQQENEQRQKYDREEVQEQVPNPHSILPHDLMGHICLI